MQHEHRMCRLVVARVSRHLYKVEQGFYSRSS
jgi:hypothetical protein